MTVPTSLTRQHFQALADALYSTMPRGADDNDPRRAAEILADRCRQWLRDRESIAWVARRFNSGFNRSRFDFWTEHGMSEAQWAAAEKSRRDDAASWTVQGNYGHGWEDLTSGTRPEMTGELATYNRDEPEYAHRVVRDRT